MKLQLVLISFSLLLAISESGVKRIKVYKVGSPGNYSEQCVNETGYPISTTKPFMSDDCATFFQCSNGFLSTNTCQAGTTFNPDLGVCDWPENVTGCENYYENATTASRSDVTMTSLASVGNLSDAILSTSKSSTVAPERSTNSQSTINEPTGPSSTSQLLSTGSFLWTAASLATKNATSQESIRTKNPTTATSNKTTTAAKTTTILVARSTTTTTTPATKTTPGATPTPATTTTTTPTREITTPATTTTAAAATTTTTLTATTTMAAKAATTTTKTETTTPTPAKTTPATTTTTLAARSTTTTSTPATTTPTPATTTVVTTTIAAKAATTTITTAATTIAATTTAATATTTLAAKATTTTKESTTKPPLSTTTVTAKVVASTLEEQMDTTTGGTVSQHLCNFSFLLGISFLATCFIGSNV